MREIRARAAIDSYDVYLEVEKEKKTISFK